MTEERPFAPAPPADCTPSRHRNSPRKSLGLIQVGETASAGTSPLAQPRAPAAAPDPAQEKPPVDQTVYSVQDSSESAHPSEAVQPASTAVHSSGVRRPAAADAHRSRAVSVDSGAGGVPPGGSMLPELPRPSLANTTIEWGTIYDDELFEISFSPSRGRTHSLDAYQSEHETGPETTATRAPQRVGRGGKRHCVGSSPLSQLPRVDELRSESPDGRPQPLLIEDKSNSFMGRNSLTILARQRSNEMEVRSPKDYASDADTDCSPRVSFMSTDATAARCTADSDMGDEFRAASPVARGSETVVLAFSAESSVDDADDFRGSLGRTTLEGRGSTDLPAGEVAPTPVRKSEKPVMSSTLTNAHVLQFHRHLLSEYEVTEVLDYRQLYFFGHGACKVDTTSPANEQLDNTGFDDKDGNYIAREGCHIAFRYEIAERLGKGSFGVVHKCMDHKDMKYVAVKIVKNRKRFHKQVVNEIKILEMIRNHADFASANIIMLQSTFTFRKHACLCFPLLGRSLFDYMKANHFQRNSSHFVRTIARQLLVSLSFLSDLNVIHCDLKPENILLTNEEDFTIKLIDFGSSCLVSEKVFHYIQSRYYRAPEVIFGFGYGKEIDMWSLACILPELRYGDPLITGQSESDQLCATAEVIGPPPVEMLSQTKKTEKLGITGGILSYTTKRNGKARKANSRPISKLVSRRTDAQFREFLAACLKWDPKERFTPQVALQHSWITGGTSKNSNN